MCGSLGYQKWHLHSSTYRKGNLEIRIYNHLSAVKIGSHLSRSCSKSRLWDSLNVRSSVFRSSSITFGRSRIACAKSFFFLSLSFWQDPADLTVIGLEGKRASPHRKRAVTEYDQKSAQNEPVDIMIDHMLSIPKLSCLYVRYIDALLRTSTCQSTLNIAIPGRQIRSQYQAPPSLDTFISTRQARSTKRAFDLLHFQG